LIDFERVNSQTPKFIDLFAGIGGFRLAFEQAGYQCVYSCEIDLACQEVYWKNFGEKPELDKSVYDIGVEKDHNFLLFTSDFPNPLHP
jgi:DNA (cytosine-5)-methyltransferase 1